MKKQIEELIELAEEFKSQWADYLADVQSPTYENDDGTKMDNPLWDYFDQKERELYRLKQQLLGE